MSDSKLKGLIDLIWGCGIFVCIAALVVAFFFCAVTRNEYSREDRSFAFSNYRASSQSVEAEEGGLDAMTAEGEIDTEAESGELLDAEGNTVDEGNEAQYFNAAEYWSAIANGSGEYSGSDTEVESDGLDA